MRRLLTAMAVVLTLAGPLPAAAQLFEAPVQGDPDAPLLLEADNLYYNTRDGTVTAVGSVFIAYRGYQVFANEVEYDQKNDVLRARNGVRLEEPEGNIVIADEFELSEDLKDGFLTGLRADTIYRTRVAANSATRAGALTIFQDAGYTACYECRRQPDKPPTWAIKARRVVYDESSETLSFEQPRFDLFGNTIAVLPSFSIPDPTVRRRSGFLFPTAVYSSPIGFGVRVPYFKTLGPSADVTTALTPLSGQGVLGDIEYRQRTASGQFRVRGAGIYQADPDAFEDGSGDRLWRGSFIADGNWYINPRWQYGFTTTLTTDRRFLDDYKQDSANDLDAPSSIYLKGLGTRNNFEARLWGFRILQDDYRSREVLNAPRPFSRVGEDLQGKQGYALPAIDYEGVYDGAVLSGELAYKFNITSVTRQETDAFGALVDGVREARFRGIEGTYTRASAELDWRKRIIAPLGNVITPHAGLRGDIYSWDNRDPNVDIDDKDIGVRGMPTVGVEYRWPWLVTAGWGSQVIEPIAEIWARPSETEIGKIPNEDAQSVVFDDTSLFGPTRFSGYDRIEGGVRANVGLRYTAQTWAGSSLAVVAGQSFHLAGRNSYRVDDVLDSGANSGLSSDESDYIAGLTLDTGAGVAFGARGRWDDQSLDLQRAELLASARFGPVSTQVVYAFLNEQPELGLVDERSEIHGAASLRVTRDVRTFGQLRYDLQDEDVISVGGGLAYDDDSLSLSLAYSQDRGGIPDEPVDHTVFFRVGLRTIGDGTVATGLDN